MTGNEWTQHFGERLREVRLLRGKTQEEVRSGTGIASKAISRYENGRLIPTLQNTIKLLDFYDIKLEDLLKKMS